MPKPARIVCLLSPVRIPDDAEPRRELVVLVEAVRVVGREARIALEHQAKRRVRIDRAPDALVEVFTAERQ